MVAEAVVCGAGIAGIAAAYQLGHYGLRDVVLVEQGDPLALTSDKSTECYRNWWPGPDGAMVALMNRSIDLLEELATATDNRIRLNRRGYLYATADPDRVARLREAGRQAALLGAGPLREHGPGAVPGPAYCPAPAHGWVGQPDGADLITDRALIRSLFPYLSEATLAVLHARRCGWFSAQQLGMLLLERARAAGTRLVRGQLCAVTQAGGRMQAVQVATTGEMLAIAAPLLVNAAGPLVGAVAQLLDITLPVHHQLHLKAAIADGERIVPRDAPLLVWADPAELGWDDEERAALAADPESGWLAGELPPGAHCRPEGEGGSTQLLMLWDYHGGRVEPLLPPPLDPEFPEIVLRGLSTMLPGLHRYLGRMPRAYLDGGYYTRTPENRPLIGPLPVAGAYVLGALSGYGLMAACAAGELLAAHVCGAALPAYAAAFAPARYGDPAYLARVDSWGDGGQL